MAQGRLPPLGNSVTEKTQVHRGGDGARGEQCTEKAGYGGKGGKLRPSRISLFKKKPYDRPLPSGTLARPSSSDRQIPSLPARLVDSASNLLTSSASYLFESFFNRRQTRWIGDGTQSTAGRGSTEAQRSEGTKPLTDNERHPFESSFQEGDGGKVGGEDTGFVEVEEFLKRQSLSREEVKRLTEVLQPRAGGGSVIDTNPEVSRRRNMLKQVSEESNPVQLAKAYMGRRMTPQWQSTPSRHNENAGPSSRKSLQDGIHERSSLEASRARVAPGATVRMLKRRLIADDEDDVVLTVPSRRVRQKMTVTPNSSPYIRQLTTAIGRPQMPSLAVSKPSDNSEKSPEHSEESPLPSKGKSVEEPATVSGPVYSGDLPESSKARDSVLDSNKESSVLLTSNDVAEPSCKPPEPVVNIGPPALENSVSGSLAASTSVILPEKTPKTKGFHISAFFEDSSSDEEADLPAKASSLSEANLPRPLLHKEAQEESMIKQPFAITPDNLPCSSAADSANIPVSVVLQPSGGAGLSSTRSDSLPMVSSAAARTFESPFMVSTIEKSTFTLPCPNFFPTVSHLPAMTDKGGESGDMPASTNTPSLIASSAALISSSLPAPTPPPFVSPAEASVPVSEAEVAAASVIFSPSETTLGKAAAKKKAAKRKVEATETGTPEASGLFSASVSRPMPVSAENVTPRIAAPAAAPNLLTAAEASAVSVSPIPLFADTPAPMPAVNQAAMSETRPINATAADSPPEAGGIRHSPMFESPSTENKQSDMDTMATDPMTEEPIVGSSAPASLFGSTSIAVSTPIGETVAFGSRSASFSFPMQSSTPSEVSQSHFNSRSSSAAGQLFPFGTSGPSPANPFSASSQSAFSFGSTAATSMSSMFPATSSAPLTFPAASPSPSPFLFGAQASPSSSTNSTSVFGGQTTPSASGFTGGGVQNNASVFSFQAPPTTTPSPPSFQFGGASAGTSSLSSTPSFGGQTFAFGGQPSNVAANPFAQSGGSNASPFQFGAAVTTASQTVFSSGVAPSSNLSYGAQPTSSPFPFTFGGQQTTASPTGQPFGGQQTTASSTGQPFGGQQTTASSTGQPFGFGGQPVAPAPSPFTLPGSTGQGPAGASGMDFAGGFSLGAAGGEKSGRKFIKAKRIGGGKRGK